MFQLSLIIKRFTFVFSDAPEFKNKTDIDEVYVEEGDNVTLNCEAEGNPASVFHWTVDGVNINISENTSNLYINQVNDSANYSCTASNYLGNITKQMHIHVAKSTMAVATPEPSAAMGMYPYVLLICSDMGYVSLISVLINLWILLFFFLIVHQNEALTIYVCF